MPGLSGRGHTQAGGQFPFALGVQGVCSQGGLSTPATTPLQPGHTVWDLSLSAPSEGGLRQGAAVREVQPGLWVLGLGWGGCGLESSEASGRRVGSSIWPTADTPFLLLVSEQPNSDSSMSAPQPAVPELNQLRRLEAWQERYAVGTLRSATLEPWPVTQRMTRFTHLGGGSPLRGSDLQSRPCAQDSLLSAGFGHARVPCPQRYFSGWY